MGVSRRNFIQLAGLTPVAAAFPHFPATAGLQVPRHASTLFETLKYSADFKQFDYVNANAPKGGRMRIGLMGSFDSLNPYTIKGDPIKVKVNIKK